MVFPKILTKKKFPKNKSKKIFKKIGAKQFEEKCRKKQGKFFFKLKSIFLKFFAVFFFA